MTEFEERVRACDAAPLSTVELTTLQTNITRRCDLACKHCHLACSPRREEEMSWAVMQQVVDLADRLQPDKVDITGGAPELHPRLRDFVRVLHAHVPTVLLRSNLTALQADDGLQAFLARHGVELVVSMPCYLEENVRAQRGSGVYERSIDALRRLNELGYGVRDDLALYLVYNPGGPVLPGPQEELEAAYRRELKDRYGLDFTALFTMTNMPIGRFAEGLQRQGGLDDYQTLLRSAFNAGTLPHLMCRHQVCVDYDGRLYDCDFNLALGMPVDHGCPAHLDELDLERLRSRRVVTDRHCFGCTAGGGSSCGGGLT